MEGFLQKCVDKQWIKYWCSLKDGCLCFYVTPNDQISADSTDLSGYKVEQLVDQYQGKRFVLSLTHHDYVDILLSLDSRDELEVWCQSITDIITAKAKRSQADPGTKTKPEPSAKECEQRSSSPSVQNVKHKLLAEMLRQKMELQKIRAARSGSRAWSCLDPASDNPSQSPSSTSPTSATVDERIRTLTRLRQRRMSTQIKMSAIQKQMEESTGSGKDKKMVFQLVRRKPDLVPGHNSNPTHQSDLEQQFKKLSSTLQDIDSSILSHEVLTSPREEVSKNKLRHSCDSSLLRLATSPAGIDSQDEKLKDDETPDSMKKDKDKSKDKDKEHDIVRSSTFTFKNSMQKLAHRTFARAHWNKLKKNYQKEASVNNNDNNAINANDKSNNSNSPTEKPPDVIDVTNSNHMKGKKFSLTDSNIFAPPDSFKTEANSSNENAVSPRKHRTPKERILSKLSGSHSFTQVDKVASRLKPSSSSPSLFKLLSKHDSKKDQEPSSPKSPLVDSLSSSIPRLNLEPDPDNVDLKSNNPLSRQRKEKLGSHHAFYSTQGSYETPERRLDSPRDENAPIRSGFYSARSEKSTTNPNRNSWSYSVMTSNRREVNPNALAEIKAFEELSSKFLGIKHSS